MLRGNCLSVKLMQEPGLCKYVFVERSTNIVAACFPRKKPSSPEKVPRTFSSRYPPPGLGTSFFPYEVSSAPSYNFHYEKSLRHDGAISSGMGEWFSSNYAVKEMVSWQGRLRVSYRTIGVIW